MYSLSFLISERDALLTLFVFTWNTLQYPLDPTCYQHLEAPNDFCPYSKDTVMNIHIVGSQYAVVVQ